MIDRAGKDLTPQEYIRQLYKQTKDGRLAMIYHAWDGKPETITYQVNWSAEDAERIVQKFNLLTSGLIRIGRLYDQLEDEQTRNALLTEGEQRIWDTYIRPYEPFAYDLAIVEAIYERCQLGDLLEEEEEIWRQYCMWREEQSRKRIPFCRRSAADMIQAARHYTKQIHMDDREAVVAQAGRSLAEEMVLYYAGKEQPVVWE